jgi:hypothetical protein
MTSHGGGGPRPPTGTVRGIVLLGPTCPVEQANSPCPDRPLGGVTVKAYRADGSVAAQGTSGDDGRFTMRVAIGDYTLRADVPSVPSRTSTPVDVHVEDGRATTVTVPVDSGIR